ncbi:cytochrome c biogenesis protein ResB [Aestuariimicrobium kwangyangense]|uniref:cytochrome c biogenesis protein ResB n=1 Tax=Aestuariimicrobium kwangyangense TaxID=396389 RepID=UPI0003B33822|nr:cytochrome c biogenesis protein ResB [Aestuariimicrobium kwangyangense]
MSDQAPEIGFVGMARWLWTQLTSMRTALVLLFLLAFAAIPGSLVPQSSTSPSRVAQIARDQPGLDKVYRFLGMYDVFTSVWFSAIYLLLFVSLVGCILPRVMVYARALRNPPPALPSRLDRLPEWGRGELTGVEADEVVAAAEGWLRRKRFRTRRTDLPDGTVGLSAERGYLREFGNLLFHVSLVVVLVGVAWNTLWGSKGSAIVVEGQGFSNNITQYDEFHAGAAVNTDHLPPFSLVLNRFTATFETGPVQTGAAREFRADVTVTEQSASGDASSSRRTIEVNHPLNVHGTTIHLISHGYAANVEVRDGSGNLAFAGPVVFLPQDGNFKSAGVIKAPDARPERLAFEGWLLPTATVDAAGPRSLFPDALNPELFLNAWSGKPKQETGRPENVYVLDTTGLTQIKNGNDLLRLRLKPGDTYQLPDQQGSITFRGYQRWTKMQFSRAPGLPLVFGSLALGVFGICLSLFVRPRRLFVKLRREADTGTLLVEAAGLDRADSRLGLSDDVADLLVATGADPDNPTDQEATP